MIKKRVFKAAYAIMFAFLALFAVVLAISPEVYVPVCLEAIILWAQCVLPALFPFMVITLIMIKTGAIEGACSPIKGLAARLKVPPAAPALFVMSAFSGYPAGSRILSEYCINTKSRDTAALLAPLCSTSGPLFIIGSVGQNMFDDKLAGFYILAAHLVSVATVSAAIMFKNPHKDLSAPPTRANGGNLLYDCFYSAVISVMVAGGFICFFYTLSAVAENLRLLYFVEAPLSLVLGSDAASALCRGLIEATGGCRALAACSSPLALPLAGFLITFGGASILAQQLCYLQPLGVSAGKFALIKAVQALLCFLLLLPWAFIA